MASNSSSNPQTQSALPIEPDWMAQFTKRQLFGVATGLRSLVFDKERADRVTQPRSGKFFSLSLPTHPDYSEYHDSLMEHGWVSDAGVSCFVAESQEGTGKERLTKVPVAAAPAMLFPECSTFEEACAKFSDCARLCFVLLVGRVSVSTGFHAVNNFLGSVVPLGNALGVRVQWSDRNHRLFIVAGKSKRGKAKSASSGTQSTPAFAPNALNVTPLVPLPATSTLVAPPTLAATPTLVATPTPIATPALVATPAQAPLASLPTPASDTTSTSTTSTAPTAQTAPTTAHMLTTLHSLESATFAALQPESVSAIEYMALMVASPSFSPAVGVLDQPLANPIPVTPSLLGDVRESVDNRSMKRTISEAWEHDGQEEDRDAGDAGGFHEPVPKKMRSAESDEKQV